MIGGENAPSFLVFRLGGLVAYLLLMLWVSSPLAAFLVRRQKKPELTLEFLGVVVAAVVLSAAAMDKIGVHPLFGAVLAGVCFPRVPRWQLALRERLNMLMSVRLLPFFFALNGMRTRLDLLNDTAMWLWAAVVLLAAVSAGWAEPPWLRAGPVNPGEMLLPWKRC